MLRRLWSQISPLRSELFQSALQLLSSIVGWETMTEFSWWKSPNVWLDNFIIQSIQFCCQSQLLFIYAYHLTCVCARYRFSIIFIEASVLSICFFPLFHNLSLLALFTPQRPTPLPACCACFLYKGQSMCFHRSNSWILFPFSAPSMTIYGQSSVSFFLTMILYSPMWNHFAMWFRRFQYVMIRNFDSRIFYENFKIPISSNHFWS